MFVSERLLATVQSSPLSAYFKTHCSIINIINIFYFAIQLICRIIFSIIVTHIIIA